MNIKIKITNRLMRSVHRDLGYFFVGLIISFSISGIALNHRENWDPSKYVYEFRRVKTDFNLPSSSITKEQIQEFSSINKLENFRKHYIREDSVLELFYKNANVEINLQNGKGEISLMKKIPVLSQTVFLHKTTNNAWIWYSDIFGLAMIIIAVTGIFMTKGKKGFWKRGLVLSLLGIVFPILMLCVFS